jgi:PAS domain-containing protein
VLQHNIFDIIPQLKNAEKLGQFHEVINGKTLHLTGVRSSIIDEVYDLHMIPLRMNKVNVSASFILYMTLPRNAVAESLEERLGFIESLVESSVDRIIVLDRNMNYLYWNQRSEEYYDIRKKDIIGKNILEVFPSL